jgi:hypothetical protein
MLLELLLAEKSREFVNQDQVSDALRGLSLILPINGQRG